MSNKVKDIDIKIRTYYVFNDIRNIENFDLNNIKIDEKSNKYILIYCIGYVTIKKYVKMYSVNSLCFIPGYVNGYFEEINENKYLTNKHNQKLINILENQKIFWFTNMLTSFWLCIFVTKLYSRNDILKNI